MHLLSGISKIKEKHKNVIYLILAFYLIYFCSSTLICQAWIGSSTALLISAIFDVLLFVLVGVSLSREQCIPLAVMIGCILATILINFDFGNLTGYVIVILRIINATLILMIVDYNRFFKSISTVIVLIAAGSVLLNLFWSVIPFKALFPRIVNVNGIGFYFAGLGFKIDSYGYFGNRNYGIFSEPAVFCFFLFIGAYFEMNSNRNKVWLTDAIIIIDCVAMISTISPVGYIAAILLIPMRLLQVKNNKIRLILYPLIIVVLIVTAMLCGLGSSLEMGINKMTISSGNGLGRAEAIEKNIELWMKNPVFGAGLSGSNEIVSELGYNTSTVGSMMSIFGTLFTVSALMIGSLSIYKTSVQRSIVALIVWLVIFFIMINNHGFIQSEWFWIFILLGLFGGEEHKKTLDSGSKFTVFKLRRI